MKNSIILFGILAFSFHVFAQDPIFQAFSALQCDSLIQANADNPNFVILDVRTPNEYNPQHLEGAINRNYFDADFIEQLDQLNKQKTYLIHCKSGSRSGSAFVSMQSMGFVEVYNMIGGINSWNSQSLPTTAEFAPRLMFVSDSIVTTEIVTIGEIDTIHVILTNRANDTLQFASISSLDGTEFYTDFNLNTTLLGAEDYQFQLFYEPTDELPDTLYFSIESNGGEALLKLIGTGNETSNVAENTRLKFKIYPNPAGHYLYLEGLPSEKASFEIVHLNGQVLFKKQLKYSGNLVDISTLQKGIYFVRIIDGAYRQIEKLVVE